MDQDQINKAVERAEAAHEQRKANPSQQSRSSAAKNVTETQGKKGHGQQKLQQQKN